MNAESTILVADDSMVVRAVVRSHLEHVGYRVVEAVDGYDAIEQCRKEPPDVVLLDVEMPGLNGHEVLAQLKSDELLRDIPVVFLTSRTGLDDVLTGLGGGAHDYLGKPFLAAELVARVGAAAHVKRLQDRLQERNAELERVSRTDMLTGLFNRRHLEEDLTRYHSAAQRNHDELSVILLDIDHFKRVNDTFGHSVGDRVLCEFADRLCAQLRDSDVPGRWGGEEFMVILPHTDLRGALEAGERIRYAVAEKPFVTAGNRIEVTVSGGCALDEAADVDEVIKLADTRLYAAKHAGRNRIMTTDRA